MRIKSADYFQRRAKKERKELIKAQGFLKEETFINITPEVCEYCLECTKATGCPGLTVDETEFGPKIVTDLSTCVSDGACAKGKVCPSFEKVTVIRQNAPKPVSGSDISREIPAPAMLNFKETYYMSTFAVGGMGAGVVSAILVRAGLKAGYQVSFLDKKGLAIRNGGVYGHVIYSRNPSQVLAPMVPYGKADLILGLDILETARGLDPKVNMRSASSVRTRAIVNTHKTPTVNSLIGRKISVRHRWKNYSKSVRRNEYAGLDFSEISQKYFGTRLYANLVLLGAAFQKGLLPVTLAQLEESVRETVSKQDLEENLRALSLGRAVALQPEKYSAEIRRRTLSYTELLREKSDLLEQRRFKGKELAAQYRKMVEEAIRWMHLDEPFNKKLAARVYELIQYENTDYAALISQVWEVYRKDRPEQNHQATRAVAENLFKVMAIKDEVYVAHLLTSEEKFRRDRERYRIDPSNGDRTVYVHLNRPQFAIWGFQFEWDMPTRNWMLNIMKQCKFLRKLLPLWHEKEKEYRDWYVEQVQNFNLFQNNEIYRAYVDVLKSPETVRGYRAVRYPTMDESRTRAEDILARIRIQEQGAGQPADTARTAQ